MISASMPFGDDDTTNLFLNINHGSFSFEMEVWAKISIECKDIICKLLTVNPAHRISIAEALKHPWMANQEDLLQKLYQKATYISHSV
jgi:calcium/calmodulin-dependent protein kinase (CaM kinase) II